MGEMGVYVSDGWIGGCERPAGCVEPGSGPGTLRSLTHLLSISCCPGGWLHASFSSSCLHSWPWDSPGAQSEHLPSEIRSHCCEWNVSRPGFLDSAKALAVSPTHQAQVTPLSPGHLNIHLVSSLPAPLMGFIFSPKAQQAERASDTLFL